MVTNLQTGRHVHLDASGHLLEHAHAEHEHSHSHHDYCVVGNSHSHPPPQIGPRLVSLEAAVLGRNDALATNNRDWCAEREILMLNFMSSPGAGKTTLLERMIRDLKEKVPLCVIEGDQATLRDAERIRATGGRVVQINTGTGCHLDARMVSEALRQLQPPRRAIVLIENVGNLVCPALFDLGEQARIVLASVTDGDDKPAKYPHMFRRANVILLNKIDLIEYVDFQRKEFETQARELNPKARIFSISAHTGQGSIEWYEWLLNQHRQLN
jgi:hydrogenase nickel incorporation protein HypB